MMAVMVGGRELAESEPHNMLERKLSVAEERVKPQVLREVRPPTLTQSISSGYTTKPQRFPLLAKPSAGNNTIRLLYIPSIPMAIVSGALILAKISRNQRNSRHLYFKSICIRDFQINNLEV